MSFASPYLLFGLLVVPLSVLGYRRLERHRAERSLAWARREMLPNLVAARSRRMRDVPTLLFLSGLTFLIVGFARPQQSLGTVHGGAPIVVLTFDVSGSMAATDIAPTRIEAARSIALRFINGLPASDRVAVVSFGDQVHLLVPPTFDRQRAIAGLPSAVVPLSGTRIGDGIDEATSVVIETVGKGYPGDPQKPGAVVLFSDGAQTSGGPTPQQAANTAYIDGIPINTVALGTSKGVVTQPARVDGFKTQVQLPVPVFPQGLATTSQLSSGIALAVGSPAQEASAARVLANVGRNLASTTLPGQRIRELSTDAAGIALALIVAAVLLSAFWFGRYV